MPEYALPFAIHQLAHQRVASPDDLVTPATTQKLSFIAQKLLLNLDKNLIEMLLLIWFVIEDSDITKVTSRHLLSL